MLAFQYVLMRVREERPSDSQHAKSHAFPELHAQECVRHVNTICHSYVIWELLEWPTGCVLCGGGSRDELGQVRWVGAAWINTVSTGLAPNCYRADGRWSQRAAAHLSFQSFLGYRDGILVKAVILVNWACPGEPVIILVTANCSSSRLHCMLRSLELKMWPKRQCAGWVSWSGSIVDLICLS